MPRYSHYIQPASGGKWPARIVCVDCLGYCEPSRTDPKLVDEKLVGWRAVILGGKQGKYRRVASYSGQGREGFWQLLTDYVGVSGVCWVFCWDAARIWALLDLWGELESGRITLSGTDYRVQGSGDKGGNPSVSQLAGRKRNDYPDRQHRQQERSDGYLVTECPPAIARIRLDNRKGWCNWVDAKNFGVRGLTCSTGSGTCVEALASWLVAMADCCHAWKLGSLCATAGSQAVHAWRHSFYKGGVYCHVDPRATATEIDAYCGGRCECFRLGVIQSPSWAFDFRSLYPAVMRDVALPVRLRYYVANPSEAQCISGAIARCIAARVRIRTEEPAYPYRRGQEIIWPVGEFDTTLCGPELEDAVIYGRVVRWYAIATYDMEPALREYSQALYALRCHAELSSIEGLADWAKAMLVSLPGKLGQKDRRWIARPDVYPAYLYGEWWGSDQAGNACRFRSIAGHVQQDCVTGLAADSNLAMAGWITSEGRMRLLRAIRQAGWENVFYVDTDSLFTNEAGYERFKEAGAIAQGQLGALQEKASRMQLAVRGIKHYEQDGRITCAGMPSGTFVDARPGDNRRDFISPSVYYRSNQKPTAQYLVWAYARDGDYRHGQVMQDGSVKPIRITDHAH